MNTNAAIAIVVLLVLVRLYQLGTAPMPTTQQPVAQAGAIALDDRQQRAYDLATRLGNTNPSIETVAWLVSWSKAEDGGNDAINRNNPWNTTQTGFNETASINGDGVKAYPTYEDGMNATVATLTNGKYDEIVAGIQTNDVQRAQTGLSQGVWGTDANAVVAAYPDELQRLTGVQEAPAPAEQPAQLGTKSIVTRTMEVSTDFYATGDVWCFQVGCQHQGVDFGGNEGDPVYAPFDLTIISLGEYGPGPTMGQFVQGTFPDGYVFYAGHLEGRPQFAVGQTLPAGTYLGAMNEYAHTHVQLAPPGITGPCAQDGTCLDFVSYYNTH